MRRHVRWLALAALLAPCCVSADGDELADPRLGDLGRVRFAGGGCSGSTTLATGSTAALTLEPQQGVLIPEDLTVASSAPSAVSATPGAESSRQIQLTAHRDGESYVELRSGGELFDGLLFRAEPASEVSWEAPEAIFVGAELELRITEVLGGCGEECPLIGGGFLDWRSSSPGALAFEAEVDRVASFSAQSPGAVSLVGLDRITGRRLVEHRVYVVAPESVTGVEATLLVAPEGEESTELVERAGRLEAAVHEEFLLQLVALTDIDGVVVPIDHQEATIRLERGRSTLERRLDGPEPIYRALRPGEASFAVEVPTLGYSGSVPLTVLPAR